MSISKCFLLKRKDKGSTTQAVDNCRDYTSFPFSSGHQSQSCELFLEIGNETSNLILAFQFLY